MTFALRYMLFPFLTIYGCFLSLSHITSSPNNSPTALKGKYEAPLIILTFTTVSLKPEPEKANPLSKSMVTLLPVKSVAKYISDQS